MFSDDKENTTVLKKAVGCYKLFRGPPGNSSQTTRGLRTTL